MSTVSGLDIANNVEREWRDRLEAAVKASVKAEREACAKVCDAEQQKNEDNGAYMWEARHCAAAIRARSNNAS